MHVIVGKSKEPSTSSHQFQAPRPMTIIRGTKNERSRGQLIWFDSSMRDRGRAWAAPARLVGIVVSGAGKDDGSDDNNEERGEGWA